MKFGGRDRGGTKREAGGERGKSESEFRSTSARSAMLFYSFFKTLTGKEVTVELKNDLAITGILHSVDQYLNIKLNEIKVVDEAKHPHLVSSSPPRSASSYADMPTDPPPELLSF